jgi:copper chaperone CopZ
MQSKETAMTILRTIIALAAVAGFSPALAQGHDHGAKHAHGTAAKPGKANPAALSGPGAVVKVNGLICDFCVQALSKTFKKQSAVRAVAVDLDSKEVRLGFKPGMSLDDATIGKLIRDAGYNVVSISRRKA